MRETTVGLVECEDLRMAEKRSGAHRKRQGLGQMLEGESLAILQQALPRHWVIHGYAPDFGIDGTVEVFEMLGDEGPKKAETLGETIFFQLKSKERCESRQIELRPRYNVEKGPYRPTEGESMSMEVIDYQLSTDELTTIEAMGAGVVVVLFLVCIETETVYFLNLTDYIDKVLDPEKPNWRMQQSVSVKVPVLNEVSRETELLRVLRFYGMRPKLMGMFTKVHFQWAELAREIESDQWPVMALHFGQSLLHLDVWGAPAWDLLHDYRKMVVEVVERLARESTSVSRPEVVDFWFRLDAISRTFEDVTREWGLPTQLGLMCSYPDS
jgi:hypothetical protein